MAASPVIVMAPTESLPHPTFSGDAVPFTSPLLKGPSLSTPPSTPSLTTPSPPPLTSPSTPPPGEAVPFTSSPKGRSLSTGALLRSPTRAPEVETAMARAGREVEYGAGATE